MNGKNAQQMQWYDRQQYQFYEKCQHAAKRKNFCLSFSFALPVQFQEFLDFKNRIFIR